MPTVAGDGGVELRAQTRADGTLVLVGHVPTDEEREDVEVAARKLFPRSRIQFRIAVTPARRADPTRLD